MIHDFYADREIFVTGGSGKWKGFTEAQCEPGLKLINYINYISWFLSSKNYYQN